jgi:hypothetical protein
LRLALGYLATVYGAAFPDLRAELADMADFIGWCGGADGAAARRLAQALASPDPMPPAPLTTGESGLTR